MSNRILIPLLLALALGGALLGVGFASLDDERQTDAAVADALAAVTPVPTAEPTPIPTPQIVLMAPPECIVAIDTLFTRMEPDLQFILDVYGAYLDHAGENVTDFGRRVEALLIALQAPPSEAADTELFRKVDVCRAAL